MHTIAAFIILVLTTFTLRAYADPCARFQATYTVESLQRARSRVKDPRFTAPADNARCGEKILSSVSLYSPPVESCDACAAEYAALLSDVAYYFHRAAAVSIDPSNRNDYLNKELVQRGRLDDFLQSAPDAVAQRYFRTNFEGIGDTMEMLHKGIDYHQRVLEEAEPARLGPKAFAIWARDIRSCDKWDFLSGSNVAGKALQDAMCSTTCFDGFRRISESADKIGGQTRVRVAAFLPTQLSCGAGQ